MKTQKKIILIGILIRILNMK